MAIRIQHRPNFVRLIATCEECKTKHIVSAPDETDALKELTNAGWENSNLGVLCPLCKTIITLIE